MVALAQIQEAMKEYDIVTKIKELDYSKLSQEDANLVKFAVAMTDNSYAPYSRFRVGAAILLSNGEIVTGANQENAAYPSGTCAERSACFYAHARYPEAKFVKIAIAARGTDGELTSEPTAPCGSCRQALLEYEKLAGTNVPVLLAGAKAVVEIESVKALLPLAFVEF